MLCRRGSGVGAGGTASRRGRELRLVLGVEVRVGCGRASVVRDAPDRRCL